MKEIYNNLFVGNDRDCEEFQGAILHACQSCFIKHLKEENRDNTFFEDENNLYLNLLDIASLSFEYATPMIKKSFQFIDEKLKQNKRVLVHCNFGVSRSASIAMLYMARKGYIDNTSFKDATKDFHKLYTYYSPSMGMYNYFDLHWYDIMEF